MSFCIAKDVRRSERNEKAFTFFRERTEKRACERYHVDRTKEKYSLVWVFFRAESLIRIPYGGILKVCMKQKIPQ